MNKIVTNIFKYIPNVLILITCIFLIIFTKNIDKSNVYLSLDHLGYIVSSIVLTFDVVSVVLKVLNKDYKTLYMLIIACFTLFFFLYTMYMFQISIYSKNLSDLVSFMLIFFIIYVFAVIFLDLKKNNIYIHITNFIMVIFAVVDFRLSVSSIKIMLVFLILSLICESFYLVLDKMKRNVIYK